MLFPWRSRANKSNKKVLRDKSPRQPYRLQIDSLEERRLLAVYIEAESSFLDPARPQDVTVQEGNAGLTNAVFRIALDAAEASPVTVNAQTADGQGTAPAVQGADYFAGIVQVSFNPGETEQFVTVGVFGDTVAELDEQFTLSLSSFTGGGGIIKAPGARAIDVAGRGTVTIVDDDVTILQIADVQVTEGDAGTVNAVFAVTLSGPDPNPVTVNFATAGGTATANNDYATTSGVLTFNPGEVSRAVTVQVIGDTQDEINETFFVNLFSPVNAQLQDSQGLGTIVDNEGIVVNIANAATLEGDTGFRDMVFTVTLSQIRPSTINVQYRTDNVSQPPAQVIPPRVGTAPFQRPAMIAQPTLAYQQQDYIPVSGLLTFAPGVTSQNITVQVRGENIHELNETFQMQLVSVTTNGGEQINVLNTSATGTINNDDQVPRLIVHDASTQGGIDPNTGQPVVTEGDNPLFSDLFPENTFLFFPLPSEPWSRPVRISVTLSNPSSGSIAAAYSTIGETATPGVDYRRSYPNIIGTTYFLGPNDAFFGDPLNNNQAAHPAEVDPPYDITEYGPGQKPLTAPGGPSPTTGLPNEYAQVIFMPGETAEDIVLRIFKEDSRFMLPVAEGDETFLIRADNFSGNSAPAVIQDDTGRVTIIDDDPDPSISTGNATIVEGDNGLKYLLFTVSVSSPLHELPISVDYVTQQLPAGPGVAEAGVDYITTQGTLTFNARVPQLPPLPIIGGVTSQAFSVPIIGDFLDELNENFQVILSNPINATIAGGTATGTIIDNEGPTATLGSDVTVVEGNAGTVNAVFNVSLSTATLQDVLIGYSTANGSATGGQDYNAVTGTITFLAGSSAPQPITVSVLGDTLFEGQEFFLLNLTNPNPGQVTIADNQALGFIVDDDFLPAVRIDDASVVEGNLGTSNLVFRVRLVNPNGSPLAGPLNQTVGVGYFTENNSALQGQDFTNTAGNLVFDHTLGETEKLVTVPVLGDTAAEADEKLLMRLVNAVNVTFFNAVAEGTIIDDDSVPGISVAARNAFEFENNNLVFDVTLSRASVTQITVVFSTANGSAISGSDFTATTGTLTFAPGETSKSVSVALTADGLVEPNETFSLGLSAPTNAVVATPSATGTIVDGDSSAIIVDNAVVTEGGNIVFPVRLSRPDASPVTVAVATANGTATDPVDYTGTSGTITFNSMQTLINLTIPTLGDTTDETNETFFLNLSNASVNLANAQGTATINDDDGPTIAINDVAGFEGDAGLVFFNFTVSLSNGSPQPVTVVFVTQDGTAIDELPSTPPVNDYFFTTGTLTFAPGEVTKTVRVNVLGDNADEVNENFTVQLSNAASNGFALGITDATGTGSIADDDGPTISSQPITPTEGTGGLSFANFSVVLSAPSPELVSVDYFTSNGTGIGNVDYFPASGTITFPIGTTAAIVAVQIVTDDLPEGDETFFLNLLNPTGGANVLATPIQATILDDDTLLSIGNATILEGDSGIQTVVLTVTMNQSRPSPVTAVFNTDPPTGTATSGADYNATTGTITFQLGETQQFVTVAVRGDLIDEDDETFEVKLSNPSGAFIGDGTGLVTIVNDADPQPIMSIANSTTPEGNAGIGNAVFSVLLSGISGRTVTAVFNTADLSAVAGSDYAAANGTLSFLQGETSKQITVPILGDQVVESNETFQLNLTGIQFATPASLAAVGTIVDDDASLAITNVTLVEGNTTANAVFAVTLSKPTSTPVTMDFATANGTAIAAQDYAAVAGTISFAAGQTSTTVTVQVTGDIIDEDNETFTLNLTNIVGAASIASSTGTATIVDDDALPDISISDTSVLEGDAGTVNAVFTVSLTQVSGKLITVVYTTNPGTALAGVDYQSLTNTLTFFPGENNKPIQVAVNGDLQLEQDETFFVDLIGLTNANAADTQGLATIIDDEPRMAIGDATLVEGNAGTTFMVFGVTLTKAAGPGNITVDYNTVPGSGTATDGVDYQSTSGVLTFFAGDNSRNISVAVIGDALNEADETFTLFLSNPNGAILSDNQATGNIVNDDPLPVMTITDVSQAEGDSGLSNFFFTVAINAPSGRPVMVNFATANGIGPTGATGGTDYQPRSGILTFQPGETVLSISVPVIGDSNVENNENFFINLTNPVNVAFGDAQGQGTIVNDEPSLVIGDATVTEQDSGSVGMVFPLTLSRASAVQITVVVNTANQTAFAPNDYTALTNTTLTFSPGQTAQNLTVQVQGDLVNEPTETFLVNLTGASSGASIGDPQGIGTILDLDPQPSISIGTATTQEGNSGTTNAVFSVMLSGASGQEITVVYSTADNTATLAGGDYFSTTGTLTFAPGVVAQAVTVLVRGDTLGEGDETYFVNLSGPANATLGAISQGVGTIVDDEPRLSIDDRNMSESAGFMQFTVTLSALATSLVTVEYATFDGTAIGGQDYVHQGGTITFQPGEFQQTINITLIGDAIDEPAETFSVTLANPSNNVSIVDNSGTGTIDDDDLPPAISISSVTVDEGNSGSTPAVFTVSLSAISGQPVSVTYFTADGTAGSATDYTAVAPTTLSFAPGELAKNITVQVNGDTLAEVNETFDVRLANPVNATLGAPITGLATISDDEPRISIASVTVGEGNSGSQDALFSVTLNRPSPGTVTVTYSTQNGTATAGSDFTGTSGTLVFNPGQQLATISVPILGDVILEPDESFGVNLLASSSNARIASVTGATGVITNDDPFPGIFVTDASVLETDVGTTNMVFTVTLSPASALAASVAFATSTGIVNPANAGTDFTNTMGTLNFAANETTKLVSVKITGDLVPESNETFLLNLSNPTNALITGGTATGTILDNDTQLSIGPATNNEGDGGITNFVFPVTLNRMVNKPVTATFSTANISAVAGSDYIAASGPISFAPNQTSQNITVQVIGDTASEPDEIFSVTLTNISGATAGVQQANGTIRNDDGLPSITISDVTVLEGNSGTSNAVFNVSLSAASGQSVSVFYNTVNGSAVAGTDFIVASGFVSFAPGQTTQQIVVQIIGDTTVESRETFSVVLSSPTSSFISDGTGIGTIDDNEISNLIMTGAGAGGGPHVRAFQSTTFAEQFGFFAYPGFTGGVRVASGDVNGDGQADMITAPGAGGGPHVRVFDGRTGAVLSEFFAFDASVTSGLFVAAGDTNGDGRAEVIVSVDGAGANGRVRLFDGTNGALVGSLTVPSAAFNGGSRIAAGDVTGDGRAEIIAAASTGNTPRVMVVDVPSGNAIADFFAYNPGFTGGVFVAAGDISGDGRADIITGADAGGGPHVRIFDGVTRQEIRGFFAYSAAFTGGVRVATTDFNNDGLVDIITGAGPGGGPHVRVWRGDNLQELAGIMAYGGFGGGVYVAGSLRGPGSPLHSTDTGSGGAALAANQLSETLKQAVSNWAAANADAAARLQDIDVRIADLPQGTLGMAYANALSIDIDADGHGWFVDATPGSDEEFETIGGRLVARSGSAAADRIDMLTVLEHELGHILGLDHSDAADDLMAEALSVGARRSAGDAVDAVFGAW